jgi:hypothetical protein
MNRYIYIPLLCLCALLVSCGDNIERLIPKSQLVGSVANIPINFNKKEVSMCDRQPDYTILGKSTVPFDIKREQIKPSLLAALKDSLKNIKKCQHIWIDLYPDRSFAPYQLNMVGRVEYYQGKITLYYGIPSDEQMREHNGEIGKTKSYTCSKEEVAKPGFLNACKKVGTTTWVVDKPYLTRPDKAFFDLGKKVSVSRVELQLKLYYERRKYKMEDLYRIVSNKLKMPYAEVKKYDDYFRAYYTWLPNSEKWGKEVYSPSK